MSTIHGRCYALYKEQKIDKIPAQNQMLEIGLLVVKKFREQTNGKEPSSVAAPEYLGEFNVRYYPAFFTPEIDSSILHFLCGKKEKVNKKKTSKVYAGNNI